PGRVNSGDPRSDLAVDSPCPLAGRAADHPSIQPTTDYRRLSAMKIALVTRRYPPLIGGAEKVLSYLAPALAEAGSGNEVTVLTSRLGEAAERPATERVATRRGSLVVRRLATSRLRFVGTWLYMRNLRRW